VNSTTELCFPLNAVTVAAMLIGGPPVVLGTWIFEAPPPISESLQASFACCVVLAAVNWVGSQVGRPFCWNLMSLPKSTNASVVGFGMLFAFPEFVEATSMLRLTGAFVFFGSFFGATEAVIV